MKIVFLFLLLGISSTCYCQDHTRPVWLTIFTNGTTLPYAPTLSPIHPGFTAGTHFTLGKNFYQTARVGYFFHRFAQHGIMLFTETGYKYSRPSGWFATGRFGAGYLHSFPHTDIFKLNDQGVYEKKRNWGRPQFMPSLTLSTGFSLEKKFNIPVEIFVDYQVWFQLPFVNQYVPVLPNVSLHLGTIFYIKRS